MGLLVGDESTLESLLEGSDPPITTWMHLLVARVLFIAPTARIYSLKEHVEWSQRVYTRHTHVTLGEWDTLLSCILQQELVQVLLYGDYSLGGGWFSAHVAHLLNRARVQVVLPPEMHIQQSDFIDVCRTK